MEKARHTPHQSFTAMDVADPGSSPFEIAAALQLRTLLRTVASELSPCQRRLYCLLYEDERCVSNAASEMGITRSAATQMRDRMIAQMRKRLAEKGIGSRRNL